MSTQPATTQDTGARVDLPSVTMDGFRHIVELLLGAHPGAADRIRRGISVLLGNAIFETVETGVYLVESCRDTAVRYTTTITSCDCPDATYRQVRCQHAWAITLLHAVAAEARWEALAEHPAQPLPPTRYLLTTKARQALTSSACLVGQHGQCRACAGCPCHQPPTPQPTRGQAVLIQARIRATLGAGAVAS